jgi:hypothetical protein
MPRRPGLHAVLFLLSVLAHLIGATPVHAQNLVLRTDKGCGAQAAYQLGEAVQILFGSSQTVNGRLVLTRPDGTTRILFDGTLRAGVTYTQSGSIGVPEGTRTLTLTAGSASATCAYTGGTAPAGSEAESVPGILDFHGTQEAVTAPATARVGEDVPVTITTFGDGCVEKGDEAVLLGENIATVFVYDLTTATRPDVRCTTILKTFSHTVTVRFTRAGEARIQVWGRRIGADTPPFGVPIVLERRIIVQ